jgi:hypothetical protein
MDVYLMKVGTLSTYHYFVKRNRKDNGIELSPGQKIKFKEQKSGSEYQTGIINKIKNGIPFVDLF